MDRKLANRMHAKTTRTRKKAYLSLLEKTIVMKYSNNNNCVLDLLNRISILETDIFIAQNQIKSLEREKIIELFYKNMK